MKTHNNVMGYFGVYDGEEGIVFAGTTNWAGEGIVRWWKEGSVFLVYHRISTFSHPFIPRA
jgi:hypothetical protein